MNRSLIVGIVGAVIVAAAIGITFFIDRPPDQVSDAAAPGTPQQGVAGLPPPAATAPPPGRAADAPPVPKSPVQPSFDIVRVNPDGNAVIAGRAAPNATVTITNKGKSIGEVRADGRGEWVLLPKKALPAGDHELSVSADGKKKGEKVQSERSVVLVVPKKGQDIAGRPAAKDDGKTGTLALSVPRDGKGPTRVLQKPAAKGNVRAEKADLLIDTLDYDENGRITLQGRAPAGARIQVYLDNRPIGAAAADTAGNWEMNPDLNVAPGYYTLRADQVLAGGKVAARIEVPFTRTRAVTGLPDGAVVQVEPGNSLWRIARRTLGDGVRYTMIFEANRDQIRDPDLIYPGQIFLIPRVN